jgi:hypothetical protein
VARVERERKRRQRKRRWRGGETAMESWRMTGEGGGRKGSEEYANEV